MLVREEGTTPRGEKPIQWLLLTNHPVRDKQEIRQVVFGYTMRWRIEEFHKTWKTGWCDVEQTQLLRTQAVIRCLLRVSQSDRASETQLLRTQAVIRWVTILAMVATRVERLKILSRRSRNQAGGWRSAFSVQPSAVSRQRSAVSVQPSAVSRQPSAFGRQRSAFSVQPSAVSRQPSAVRRIAPCAAEC